MSATRKDSAFEAVDTERPHELARLRNGQGWALTAVDVELSAGRYRGVAVSGPRPDVTGYYPRLHGVELELLPKYVADAARRLHRDALPTEEQLAAAAEANALEDRLLA